MVDGPIDFEERIRILPYQENPHVYYRQLKAELERVDLESRERLSSQLEEVYDNYEREMDDLLLRVIYGNK